MLTVTSEIYQENNLQTINLSGNKVISKFKFKYPNDTNDEDNNSITSKKDKDGDYVVKRKTKNHGDDDSCGIIEIEHSLATEISLVGLQVWRGALLLADFCFFKRNEFQDKQILELGSGVGLTSIAAGIYTKNVISTDVNIGGILNIIQNNIQRNRNVVKNSIKVLEYDFKKLLKNHSKELIEAIDESDIVLAADVIYDDDLILAFINVLDDIFARQNISKRNKCIYIALEKRYVFTVNELDTIAPMFDYFIQKTLQKKWQFKYINIDFPQYFEYERNKNLILLQITSQSQK